MSTAKYNVNKANRCEKMPMRLASGVLIVFAIWLSTIACDSESGVSGKRVGTATPLPRSTSSYLASTPAPRRSTYTRPKTAQQSSPATPTPKATPTPDWEAATRHYAESWWGLVEVLGTAEGWYSKDLSFDEAKVRFDSSILGLIDDYLDQIEYYGIDVYYLYPYCITTLNLIHLESLMYEADHPATAYVPTEEIIQIINRAQDSELQAASWEERTPPYSTQSIKQCEEYFDYVQLHGYTPSPVN